ncbi:PfkB domain-containing protein, partial [Haematococcus lacustris]
GGSVSYAAVAAKALGLRACVVTTAGPGFNTSVFDGHELHIVPAEHTLTFEHSYGSALAALWWGLADRWWRGPQQLLAVIAQGHQRTLGPRGVVQQLPTPSSELMAAMSPRMSVFLSDVETEGWSPADLGSLAAGSARLIITAGAKGAQEWDWAARRVKQ